MDWTIIALALIVFVLGSIKGVLDKIARYLEILSNKPDFTQSHFPSFPSLEGIESQLQNIYKIMGGEAKMKEERLKRHKEHYSMLVKALVLSGKTQKQAEEEANGYLEENEYDETLGDDYFELTHYAHPSKTMSALKWAKAQFVDDRNNKKYGHLLPRARDYLNGKTTINLGEIPFKSELTKLFVIDYEGGEWLVSKLIQEKRLKAITEYNHEDSRYDVKHYEVLEPEK